MWPVFLPGESRGVYFEDIGFVAYVVLGTLAHLTRANHDETIALLAPRIWTGRRITLPLWTPMRQRSTSVVQEN